MWKSKSPSTETRCFSWLSWSSTLGWPFRCCNPSFHSNHGEICNILSDIWLLIQVLLYLPDSGFICSQKDHLKQLAGNEGNERPVLYLLSDNDFNEDLLHLRSSQLRWCNDTTHSSLKSDFVLRPSSWRGCLPLLLRRRRRRRGFVSSGNNSQTFFVIRKQYTFSPEKTVFWRKTHWCHHPAHFLCYLFCGEKLNA